MTDSATEIRTSCPACGTSLTEGRFHTEPYPTQSPNPNAPSTIQVCDKCLLGIASPMLSEEALAKLYEGNQAEYWSPHKIKQLSVEQYPIPCGLAQARWDLVRPFLPEDQLNSLTVIDIGAGFGFFGIIASQKTAAASLHYFAVEPDRSLHEPIRRLWETLKLPSRVETVTQMEEVAEKADLLVLSHILEHVPNPVAFLQKVWDHLKPGGFLLVDVPNQDQRFKSDVFPHLFFFTPENLSLILKQLGLELLDVDGWGRDWEDSPLSEKNRRPLLSMVDRLASLACRLIPLEARIQYFKKRLGISRRSRKGTWIRVVARKPD